MSYPLYRVFKYASPVESARADWYIRREMLNGQG